MAYQISIQDFASPVFAGIKDYFSGSTIVYSSFEGNDFSLQENPHEIFKDKGMERLSTIKWENEVTPAEIYHDTAKEEYILEEPEEEIRIVSWEKAAEEVLQESGDFSEEGRRVAEHASGDFF
jgi:hypothetical protein